ncbi:hypothetical protein HDE_03696 [Halotydeus destructor]|nr:hypothetical protein HDE_03696 [Halotydeus destructor]
MTSTDSEQEQRHLRPRQQVDYRQLGGVRTRTATGRQSQVIVEAMDQNLEAFDPLSTPESGTNGSSGESMTPATPSNSDEAQSQTLAASQNQSMLQMMQMMQQQMGLLTQVLTNSSLSGGQGNSSPSASSSATETLPTFQVTSREHWKKIPEYNGETDLEEWRLRVEFLKQVNGWTDLVTGQLALQRLAGSAMKWIANSNLEVQSYTFSDLLEFLRDSTGQSRTGEEAYFELLNARQLANEQIVNFIHRVNEIAVRYDCQMPDGAKIQHVLHGVKQIYSKPLRLWLANLKTINIRVTLNSFIKYARSLEEMNQIDSIRENKNREAARPNNDQRPSRPEGKSKCEHHPMSLTHSTDECDVTKKNKGEKLTCRLCPDATNHSSQSCRKLRPGYRPEVKFVNNSAKTFPKKQGQLRKAESAKTESTKNEDEEEENTSDLIVLEVEDKSNEDEPSLNRALELDSREVVKVQEPDVGRTMFVCGKIDGHKAIMVVDSGAEMNCISADLAKKLKLETRSSTCGIVDINGCHKKALGAAKATVDLTGSPMKVDLVLLPRSDPVIILGMPFLKHPKANADFGEWRLSIGGDFCLLLRTAKKHEVPFALDHAARPYVKIKESTLSRITAPDPREAS